MKNTKIVNNVQIIEDGDVTTFIPLEEKPKTDNRNWFQKLVDWFKTSKVTPYVKIKNMANPQPEELDPGRNKTGVEVGIQVKF